MQLEPIDMPSQEQLGKSRRESYYFALKMAGADDRARKAINELWDKINKEGHVEHWIHNGKYLCRINRDGFGDWCGYVSVPQGHPLYGVHYDAVYEKYPNVDSNVHGGLTFSELVHNWGKDMWVFGFDCGHAFDVNLNSAKFAWQFPDMTYKDKEYVKRETNELARQLEEIEEEGKR